MFSLPHFQIKSVNISTILISKLKTSVYIGRLVSWLLLELNISLVESSVNKQIRLNYILFLHRVYCVGSIPVDFNVTSYGSAVAGEDYRPSATSDTGFIALTTPDPGLQVLTVFLIPNDVSISSITL